MFRDEGQRFFTCSFHGDYNACEDGGKSEATALPRSFVSGSLLHSYTTRLFFNCTTAACGCPCDDLVTVEAPTILSTLLPYVAQAAVTTIVGFNMGFR